MGAQITPTGIKFDGYDDEQTRPIRSVSGVEPDNDGNIILNMSSTDSEISGIESELDNLEQVTYILSSTPNTSIDEGYSVTITLTTTNILDNTNIPYTITGNNGFDISQDFVNGNSSGNFIIQENTASISLEIKEDFTTESGSESFTLSLGVSGNPFITIDVNDTSLSPTYSLSSSTATVNEGQSVLITLNTTNVPNNTNVPYTISTNGLSLTQDFTTSVSSSGNFLINNNVASVTFVLKSDKLTEPASESFTLTVNAGDNPAVTIDVNDTSLSPTYALSSSSTTVDEGQSVTITLNTTNLDALTVVPYTITANGISLTDDFSSHDMLTGNTNYVYPEVPTSGNFLISSDGSDTVTFGLKSDLLTESGAESFTLTLGVSSNPSVTINVNDSSQDEAWSLEAWNNGTVDEGYWIRVTLHTSNLPDNSTAPYTITENSINLSEDISSQRYPLTSTVTSTGNFGPINNNIAFEEWFIAADSLTEGVESFTVSIQGGGNPSITIFINDTSTTPASDYTLTSNKTSVNEGESFTITMTSTPGVQPSSFHQLYYSLSGTTGMNNSDFSENWNIPISNSLIFVNNNVYNWPFSTIEDSQTEGLESLTLTLHGDIDHSVTVDINDTSNSGGGSGSSSDYQIFTSNGTWTPPSGVTEAKIYITGAGASGTEGYGAPFVGAEFVGGDTLIGNFKVPNIGDAIDGGTVSVVSISVGVGTSGTANSYVDYNVTINKSDGSIVTNHMMFRVVGSGLAQVYMPITAYHDHTGDQSSYRFLNNSNDWQMPNTTIEYHAGYAPHRSHSNATQSPSYYGSSYHYWRNTGTGANPSSNNVFGVDPTKGLPNQSGVVVIAWGDGYL